MNESNEFSPNNPEIKNIKPGKYTVKVSFFKGDGSRESLKVKTFDIKQSMSLQNLIAKSVSETVGLGLHNFGLDVNSQHYPNGQSVDFEIQDGSNRVINSFSKTFNGSGYVIS